MCYDRLVFYSVLIIFFAYIHLEQIHLRLRVFTTGNRHIQLTYINVHLSPDYLTIGSI
jgi:hypothetical protein